MATNKSTYQTKVLADGTVAIYSQKILLGYARTIEQAKRMIAFLCCKGVTV